MHHGGMVKTFNSLFEMRLQDKAGTDGLPIQLSILYLRCKDEDGYQTADTYVRLSILYLRCKTAEAEGMSVSALVLSILYLRCRRVVELSGTGFGMIAFNSLFEMPISIQAFVWPLIQLSILYLRCRDLGLPKAHAKKSLFQFSI